MKSLLVSNIILFGLAGCLVLISWSITIWTYFNIQIASGVMTLASVMASFSCYNFISNSLKIQRQNKIR